MMMRPEHKPAEDMLAAPLPTIGRIMHYRLTQADAEKINRRREHARKHSGEHALNANGVQIHVGNKADEGQALPMMVVAVNGPDTVNGQVYLDGNDIYWITGVRLGNGPGTCSWPLRQPGGGAN